MATEEKTETSVETEPAEAAQSAKADKPKKSKKTDPSEKLAALRAAYSGAPLPPPETETQAENTEEQPPETENTEEPKDT